MVSFLTTCINAALIKRKNYAHEFVSDVCNDGYYLL